jgi:hypothetical protein
VCGPCATGVIPCKGGRIASLGLDLLKKELAVQVLVRFGMRSTFVVSEGKTKSCGADSKGSPSDRTPRSCRAKITSQGEGSRYHR